jgi:ABC-type sugar transport system ATPase subunit
LGKCDANACSKSPASRRSYGPNRVLAQVDFHLEAKASVAIIGENGAGKSTFAKILTGVIRPDE